MASATLTALAPSASASRAPHLPVPLPPVGTGTETVLALDLGTTTGFAIRTADGRITSGMITFRSSRFEGGGMRYLRFQHWLREMLDLTGPIERIVFEEVRRHIGTDAAHVYGGLLGTLTAWGERHAVPYEGVPVGTIKRFATGKGNANKTAMIAAMQARGFHPGDDNEADALALLLWAIEGQGGRA
jgi:Holliday junction resolvasome RuvABC endonuclease subunit